MWEESKGDKEDKGSQCVGRLRRLEATGVDKETILLPTPQRHSLFLTPTSRSPPHLNF